MGLISECPLPVALNTTGLLSCQQHFNQVKRFLFQRKQAAPTFPTVAGIGGAATLASWTPLLASITISKVAPSPLIDAGFTLPEIEAKLEGGDDDTTLDGMPIVLGGNTARAAGHIRGLTGSVYSSLLKYIDYVDLTAFFVTGSLANPKIWGYSANGITVEGIPIYSFFVGDPAIEGHNTHTKSPISFSLPFRWREKLVEFTATDFNPLTLSN